MKKKILITGIAGFIGFHLAKALKKRGDDVIGLDNFNPYYDPELKINRKDLLKQTGIEVLSADICDRKALLNLLQNHQTTHFVHLAAQAGVRYSFTHADDYIHSNLQGFTSVLEALKTQPHIKLTFASSSSVYGTNSKVPFSECDTTDSPANLYGATKKSNEVLAAGYHNLYGLSVTGLRYFTAYGPWGRPDMAYYLFTEKILKNETIKLFGNGKMKRDFTYIDDIIQGTIAAIDLEAKNELFNLGNHTSVEVLSLIETLEKLLNKKARCHLIEDFPGEASTTYADISKAEKILNYSPQTKLEEGLKEFLVWYEKYTASKHQVYL